MSCFSELDSVRLLAKYLLFFFLKLQREPGRLADLINVTYSEYLTGHSGQPEPLGQVHTHLILLKTSYHSGQLRGLWAWHFQSGEEVRVAGVRGPVWHLGLPILLYCAPCFRITPLPGPSTHLLSLSPAFLSPQSLAILLGGPVCVFEFLPHLRELLASLSISLMWLIAPGRLGLGLVYLSIPSTDLCCRLVAGAG